MTSFLPLFLLALALFLIPSPPLHHDEPQLQAEDKVIAARSDKEYLPITGLADFTKAAATLAYGADSAPLQEGRVAITQSLSGTGALRIAGAFLARHFPGKKEIYVPAPTWGNHIPIFKDSGLDVKYYSYYDKKTVGLDFEGLKKDLRVRYPLPSSAFLDES